MRRIEGKVALVTGAASGIGAAFSPPRAIAMASISSMNPMAPPSWRAALRRALKYERIFLAVAP